MESAKEDNVSTTVFYVSDTVVEFEVEVRDPSPGGAPCTQITVVPSTVTVAPSGGTQQLAVTPKDAGGNALSNRTVAYITENSAIATVNASGLVTGVALGTCNVYVWCENVVVVVPVTVQSGAWIPTSSAGLEQWIKGDAGITIGTGVSAWADQSGKGRGYAQPTGSKQPLNSNTINGLAVVTFDGVDDVLDGSGVFPTAMPAGPYTEIVVFKLVGTPGATKTMLQDVSDGTVMSAVVFNNGSAKYMIDGGNGNANARTIPDGVDTNLHKLIITWDGAQALANADYAVRLDAVAKAVSASGLNHAHSTLDRPALGAQLRDVVDSWLAFHLCERFRYSRVLPAGEIASAEGYIQTRWGI
jgi:hypothetical protein